MVDDQHTGFGAEAVSYLSYKALTRPVGNVVQWTEHQACNRKPANSALTELCSTQHEQAHNRLLSPDASGTNYGWHRPQQHVRMAVDSCVWLSIHAYGC